MGYGRINVWVRERDSCCVADMDGYAWVKCCCDPERMIQTRLKNGHAELKVPPGTYIVDASWRPGCCGEAKETIAIVGCGETVCVNLIREWAGDPVARIVAFSAHAKDAGLSAAERDNLVKGLTALAGSVPKEKIRYYTEAELALRNEVSDQTHKRILRKYKKTLTGQDRD